jgi:cell division protein FtsI (penicillin-binding protein 3)
MTMRAPEVESIAEDASVAVPPQHRSLGRFYKRLFSTNLEKGRGRIRIIALSFVCLFATINARLIYLGFKPDPQSIRRAAADALSGARPDILDRNGEVLATDVKVMSVFAEPRRIIDKDEATELLTAVLPDVNARELRDRLASRKGFVWVKRGITPKQQQEVYHLGLPGVGFLPENKRVYPNGPIAAHVLGFANLDNVGIAGIEKYIDGQGLADLHNAGLNLTPDGLKPIQLSLDLRLTHGLRCTSTGWRSVFMKWAQPSRRFRSPWRSSSIR